MPSEAPGAATLESLRMSCCTSLYTSMTRVALGFCWSGKQGSTWTSPSSRINICRTHHLRTAHRA